ncbi:hypothetical protein JHK87_044807 [Glycine soja]|nr:hypothetical protein JHK87_044807 [Glycine soja]
MWFNVDDSNGLPELGKNYSYIIIARPLLYGYRDVSVDERGLGIRPGVMDGAISISTIQILKTDLFHADPHPGNLAIDVDEAIIYYDFGMMGEIKSFTQERLLELFYAMYEKDAKKVMQRLIELGALQPTGDLSSVAAGWPSWLSKVAGEAINGLTPRRADTFEQIDKIGQGTYNNVYKARDTLTGKIVALRKVRFDNLEPESVKFMAREILILQRLDHPNVIKLEGLVTSRMSCSLYLVFEYMVHDLAGLATNPTIQQSSFNTSLELSASRIWITTRMKVLNADNEQRGRSSKGTTKKKLQRHNEGNETAAHGRKGKKMLIRNV